MIRRIAFALAVLLAVALPAAAGTISVTQAIPDAPVGYVMNDIAITTAGTWTQMQLLTDGLSNGDIYQDDFGGNTPPKTNFLALVPSLAADTFLANGSPVEALDTNDVLVPGGAVNLGGSAGKMFGKDKLDVTWTPAPGQAPTDVVDWLTARITLRDTANGTFRLFSSDTDGKGMQTVDGTISEGVMKAVPEPSTFVMLAIGSLGLMLLRRRRIG